MKTRSVLVLGFLVGCADRSEAPKEEPRAAVVPSSLEAAQEAYLKSDWPTMSDRLRDVLLDRSASELVRDNAFELLDKAYEATNGKLPSRFALPPSVRTITLGSMRGQHQWATYRSIFFYAQVEKGRGAHVTDVAVRSLPGDDVVVDRAKGIGSFRITPREKWDDVLLEAKDVAAPLPDGVATIHFAFDDDAAIDTWVLVRGEGSSASPEVLAPATSATLSEASPTVEWTPFRSPEYASFEDRAVSIYVGNDKTKAAAFDHYVWQPGDLARVKIDPKLAPGSYWLAFTMQEERTFGPIRLARHSQRGVPFTVVP